MNSLVYRTLFYANIYRSYKLSKKQSGFWPTLYVSNEFIIASTRTVTVLISRCFDARSASRSARTLVGQQVGDTAVQCSVAQLNDAASSAAAVDPPWYRTFPPFTAVRSSRASDTSCRSLPAMALLTPLAPVASTSKSKKHDSGQ